MADVAERQFEWSAVAAIENFQLLGENEYPGRLIVQGVSPTGDEAVQVYAVMGRSDDSRNRLLVEEGEDQDHVIKTVAFDEEKVKDPSLIIYNALRPAPLDVHVVSNGHQTDAVIKAIRGSRVTSAEDIKPDFARVLTAGTRAKEKYNVTSFEPDGPNFTARITGFVATSSLVEQQYGWVITRRGAFGLPVHTVGGGLLDSIPVGRGLAMHTYNGDGKPLPTFTGDPYPVPVEATAAETAERYWEEALDGENRVAVVAKFINRVTGEIDVKIINQLAA
jgi:IMP cyclohydrolase